MKKVHVNILRFLVAILILSFLTLKIGVENLQEVMKKVNLRFIFLAILIYIFALFAVSYRLKLMLKNLDLNLGISQIFWCNMLGMLVSEVTPGRVGYLTTAYALFKKGKIKKSRSLSVILSVQVLDFSLRTILALAAFFYLFYTFKKISEIRFMMLLGISTLFLITFFLLILSTSREITKLVEHIPYKSEKIKESIEIFQRLHRESLSDFTNIFILTLSSWIFTGARWIFVGNSLSLNLSPLTYLLLQPLILSLSFLPITLGGLGITEGAVAGIFVLLGVEPEAALAFALLDRGVVFIVGIKEIGEI
ncbi:MAG: lysylphosphatidylglycerol synthase transmembrane domain-containing protein [Candidatus Methanofastidiosia archaeon]